MLIETPSIEPTDIPTNIQMHALILLVNDKEKAPLVRNTLPLSAWAGPQYLKRFIAAAYGYIDKYNEAPGDHAYDLLDDINITGEEHDLMTETVGELIENFRVTNIDYAINLISAFNRQSTWENAAPIIAEFAKTHQFAELEDLVRKCQSKNLEVFEKKKTMLEYLIEVRAGKLKDARRKIKLGIPALDVRGLGPGLQELWLLIAKAKKGKSQGLVHVGKCGLMQQFKILYVTLELSRDAVLGRFVSSIYGVSNRPTQNIGKKRIVLDDKNGFDYINLTKEDYTFSNESDVDNLIEEVIKRKFLDNNLYVKKFPMAGCSIHELRSFMDSLEMKERFIPNYLLLDYPDIMKLPGKQDRWQELGVLYQQIKGLADERNIGVAAVTQGKNTDADTLDDGDVGGAWDKIATADTVITYSQSDLEYQKGLARLFVSNGRTEESRFKILITQNYGIGQWAMTSALMTGDMHDRLKAELKQ